MKSSTIHTLAVAVAMALSATSSMAGTVEPVSQSEKHTTSATAAISAAPFYALNRLDAQSLAEQEMTDQELKAVEGGWYFGSGISGITTTYHPLPGMEYYNFIMTDGKVSSY